MSKTYHFIGIKGSGMSALALMLHQMGHKVQGSDVEKYYFTQRGLEQAGITILPFSEDNITEDMELIVGNAFREDNNNEVAYAIQHELPFKRYHEFLGDFMKQFISFGVAGAHGKTSTTGLLSHVLKNITDTSYLIEMALTVVQPMHNISFSNQMNMSVISCLIIQNIPSLPILILIILTILQGLMMCEAPLMIMPNRLRKPCLSTVKIRN